MEDVQPEAAFHRAGKERLAFPNQEDSAVKRLIWDDLLAWKARKNRKPLILRGVRQSGKTWLLKAFGRECFASCAYFNFEGNPRLYAVFATDLNPDRIIQELELLQNSRIDLAATLIVFDEIQFCNQALISLKYFNEQKPEAKIVAAGSLLGLALAKPLSFPVGKVEFLDLHPLTFREFLMAQQEDLVLERLDALKAGEPVPESIHPSLVEQLHTYYYVGGMPEAVQSWVENRNPANVATIQRAILDSYELDFAKHAPDREFEKLSAIWHAIPAQLARENQKFVFNRVKAGARGRDLESALQWLLSAGLVYKISKIEKPGIPLSAYADDSHFKIYLCDVGLMRSMADVTLLSIKQGDAMYAEFRGAIAENYVLTELVASHPDTCVLAVPNRTPKWILSAGSANTWSRLKSRLRERVRSKSLGVYIDKYKPDIAIRLSMKNAGSEPPLYCEPLYLDPSSRPTGSDSSSGRRVSTAPPDRLIPIHCLADWPRRIVAAQCVGAMKILARMIRIPPAVIVRLTAENSMTDCFAESSCSSRSIRVQFWVVSACRFEIWGALLRPSP